MADPGLGILGCQTDSGAGDPGTLCRTVSHPPGPIGACGYEWASLGVRVVSAYEPGEGIAHALVIRGIDGAVIHRELVGTTWASQPRPTQSTRLLAGTYLIEVEPLPPPGQSIGPVRLSDAFRKLVHLDPAKTTDVRFEVKRKQAILHNIPVLFHVADNAGADGSEPIYELSGMSAVAEHSKLIVEEAKRQGVDPDFVKAIMYMETTHGYYDGVLAVFDANKSLLPMNINQVYWSELPFSRADLETPKKNIEAGVWMIKRLAERVVPNNVRTLATLYQDVGATRVTDYGARVEQIYRNKAWIPEAGPLERLELSVHRFEQSSPLEQVRILERMFGGR